MTATCHLLGSIKTNNNARANVYTTGNKYSCSCINSCRLRVISLYCTSITLVFASAAHLPQSVFSSYMPTTGTTNCSRPKAHHFCSQRFRFTVGSRLSHSSVDAAKLILFISEYAHAIFFWHLLFLSHLFPLREQLLMTLLTAVMTQAFLVTMMSQAFTCLLTAKP